MGPLLAVLGIVLTFVSLLLSATPDSYRILNWTKFGFYGGIGLVVVGVIASAITIFLS